MRPGPSCFARSLAGSRHRDSPDPTPRGTDGGEAGGSGRGRCDPPCGAATRTGTRRDKGMRRSTCPSLQSGGRGQLVARHARKSPVAVSLRCTNTRRMAINYARSEAACFRFPRSPATHGKRKRETLTRLARRNRRRHCRSATCRGIAGPTVRQWLHHGPRRLRSSGAASISLASHAHWTPEPCLANLGVWGRAPAITHNCVHRKP